jgi:tetratricopeptide (TPR) repeat protein
VGAFPVHSRFGLDQGFDVYDDSLDEAASRTALAERRGADVVSAARRWLTENGTGRTFTWVHLFDPHAPYDPPAPFPRGYDGEVAYVDGVVGDLLAGAGKDVLVIVMADHGEGLGDHGEETHSLFIYDSTTRIPLILKGPGVPAGLEVSAQVRSIDVLPTVLDFLGLEDRCAACQGESLVPLLSGGDGGSRVSYAETYFPRLNLGWSELRSLRAGGFKYVEAPEPELYDVSSDPGETRNLADQRPEKVRELRSSLRAMETGFELPNDSEVDRETLAALRSLGYVTARTPPDMESRPDPKSRLPVWNAVQSGMDLVARGKWEEAITRLEGVTRDEPELLLARTHLAAAYFQKGRYQEVGRECGAILSRDADDFDATLLLGRSLLRMGQEDESRRVLVRATELDPSSAAPWVELAQLSLRRSRADAERFLSEARKRDAGAADVLVMEGKLATLSGDASGAESLFRRAIDAAPYESEPRVQLGNLLLAQRRLDEAAGLFEEGLRTEPESAVLHLGLGHSFALAGKMDRAIESFESALALDPGSPLVLNSLGFAYLEAGSPEKAQALFTRSLEIAPDQPQLRDVLGPKK